MLADDYYSNFGTLSVLENFQPDENTFGINLFGSNDIDNFDTESINMDVTRFGKDDEMEYGNGYGDESESESSDDSELESSEDDNEFGQIQDFGSDTESDE
tara:strand:- start:371 stop:673 length:303 start_codon:yes stop_codon:yes gene_type:complete